ncbi:MAG: hypothetical protein JW932_17535 [Deltaproteobacteria bacterium]|nr:hypothetical protein [Deltaproteobacteria bacterium]
MKQQLLAVILSALVVPGLGQVINRQIKKGIILMIVVFILFIAGTVQLAILLTSSIQKERILNPMDTVTIIQNLRYQDLPALWIVVIIFGLVWLYAVVDAFLGGRNRGEILLNR